MSERIASVDCVRCQKKFETVVERDGLAIARVTCFNCNSTFNRFGYVKAGAYLYAFVTVNEENELIGWAGPLDNTMDEDTLLSSPDDLKKIALEECPTPVDEDHDE